MKLNEAEALPGSVISISDPEHLGRVKADVPTLFDSSVMNEEGLPWIYPCTMIGYQGYSALKVGSPIWVIRNIENYQEFWYLPMTTKTEEIRNIITKSEEDYEDAEVLICRNAGGKQVYMYYTPSDGFMIKVGDMMSINISNDDKIIINNDKKNIVITKDQVNIGSGNSEKHAVMYEQLEEMLNSLKTAFNQLSMDASSPYTANLIGGFTQCVNALNSGLTQKTFRCENTFVD